MRGRRRGLSRRTFVKGGGALIVGLASAAAARRGRPSRRRARSRRTARPTRRSRTPTSRSSPTTPCSSRRGRVELGQGSTTGLLLLVAEELDMNVDQLVFVRQDTNVTPDTGGTFGSSSIARPGSGCAQRAPRRAAEPARAGVAATRRAGGGSSASRAASSRAAAGRSPTARCVGGRLLGVPLPAPILDPGQAPAKPISRLSRWSGISQMPRLDIPAKVIGTYTYIHNVRVPGMLHGRLIRPLGQGAYGDGTLAGIVSVDERSIAGHRRRPGRAARQLPRASSPRGSTTRSRRRRG